MEADISVDQLINAVLELPIDNSFKEPKKTYTTQKEHWLRWLSTYDEPGYYGRMPHQNRNARFAYNHIVEPKMLVYLIAATGTRPDLADSIRSIMAKRESMSRKSSAIRKLVPWEDVAKKLFVNRKI